MTRYHTHLVTSQDEVYRSLLWLLEEWEYVEAKFGDVSDRANDGLLMAGDEGVEWWARQVGQYYDRAKLFGVNTPRGRQAMAKAMATAIAACAAAVRVHGDLPIGGTPSGEAIER